MADISEHLGDGDLSVAEIAIRHRVTPRYIHKLFENEGLTFSSFVLGQRLSRAHRILSDPHLADRNISLERIRQRLIGQLAASGRRDRRPSLSTQADLQEKLALPSLDCID